MKDNFKLDSDRYYDINDSKKQKKISESKTKDLSLLFISLFLFIFIGLGGVLLVSEINNGKIRLPIIKPPITEEENNGVVKKFKDHAELKEFLEEGIATMSGYGYGNYLGGVNASEERMDISKSTGDMQTWGSESAPSGVPIKGMGGDDYSTTNIQVGGVDEGESP